MPEDNNCKLHSKKCQGYVIVEYAKMAKAAWEKFSKDGNSQIGRFFHLRPTNSGVSIISTLPGYEMRGIVNIRDEESLLAVLSRISREYKRITSLDEDLKIKIMGNDLKFSCRPQEKKDNKLEEKIQALMINTMGRDRNLAEKLGAKSKFIHFIASELIFEQGHNRVDIVGYDGQDLYFFELKKDRTTKIEQVKDYVEYYTRAPQVDTLSELLKNYPIHSVDSFGSIKGVMVMEDAENSTGKEKWKSLGAKNKVDILFYAPSLEYKHVI